VAQSRRDHELLRLLRGLQCRALTRRVDVFHVLPEDVRVTRSQSTITGVEWSETFHSAPSFDLRRLAVMRNERAVCSFFHAAVPQYGA
jgi:hypothetical protein